MLDPATGVPEPIINRLIDRTQGVPLLIHDLIRGLRREGLVRQQPGGVWVVATEVLDRMADFPLTQWLANRELDELPADLADHARLVSLLSTEFTLEEVEGVLGAMDSDLLDAFPIDARVGTERLEQAGMLVRRGTERLTRTEVMHERWPDDSEVLAGRSITPRWPTIGTALCPMPPVCRGWRGMRRPGRAEEAAVAYLTGRSRGSASYLEPDALGTRPDPADGPGEESRLRAYKGRGHRAIPPGATTMLADPARRRITAAWPRRRQPGGRPSDEAMALDWLMSGADPGTWPSARSYRREGRWSGGSHPSGSRSIAPAVQPESVTLLREAGCGWPEAETWP